MCTHVYLELDSSHASPDKEDVSFMDGTVRLEEVRLQEHIKQVAKTAKGRETEKACVVNLTFM